MLESQQSCGDGLRRNAGKIAVVHAELQHFGLLAAPEKGSVFPVIIFPQITPFFVEALTNQFLANLAPRLQDLFRILEQSPVLDLRAQPVKPTRLNQGIDDGAVHAVQHLLGRLGFEIQVAGQGKPEFLEAKRLLLVAEPGPAFTVCGEVQGPIEQRVNKSDIADRPQGFVAHLSPIGGRFSNPRIVGSKEIHRHNRL